MTPIRSEDEMVAYALEIHPSLLPYLPELLADLGELGSDAQAIAGILNNINLPGSTSVVDLGCGRTIREANGLVTVVGSVRLTLGERAVEVAHYEALVASVIH